MIKKFLSNKLTSLSLGHGAVAVTSREVTLLIISWISSSSLSTQPSMHAEIKVFYFMKIYNVLNKVFGL